MAVSLVLAPCSLVRNAHTIQIMHLYQTSKYMCILGCDILIASSKLTRKQKNTKYSSLRYCVLLWFSCHVYLKDAMRGVWNNWRQQSRDRYFSCFRAVINRHYIACLRTQKHALQTSALVYVSLKYWLGSVTRQRRRYPCERVHH